MQKTTGKTPALGHKAQQGLPRLQTAAAHQFIQHDVKRRSPCVALAGQVGKPFLGGQWQTDALQGVIMFVAMNR